LELVPGNLQQISSSTMYMYEFSHFNQILVNLFDVSNIVHYSILICLHTV